ncbi:MAG: hypothetical protein ACQETB_00715 [Halobacteriota archaeon]
MVLEGILGLAIAFVIVVAGSYVGAKMALNTFFGRDFDPSEIDRSTPADGVSSEIEQ